MEITSASTAKANYVKGLNEEEEDSQKEQSQEKEPVVDEKPAGDEVSFTKSELDESAVKEKVNNYIQNLLTASNLTDQAHAALQQYINNFDVAKFIKNYGPFDSVRDISAAMFAATSGLVKYKQEDE